MPEAGMTGGCICASGGVLVAPAVPGCPPPGSSVLLTRTWLQTSFLYELLSLLYHLS